MNPPLSKVPALKPRVSHAVSSRVRPQTARPRRGKAVLALLGAVALPAFAAPGEWDRFEIGDAGAEKVQLEPMPFETAGSSFPGSAFYYLDIEGDVPGLGEGIHSDADSDATQQRLDTGPAARTLRIAGNGPDRTRALECLTAAIYYEAASEPDAGQRAVAQVVLNRVAHPSYPNTVCGVVYQGSQRRTGCQFTFTCDGSLARKPSRMFWERAEKVAKSALDGAVFAPAGLATHYHTVQVSPYWAPSLHYLGTIGAHRFYSFGGHAGSLSSFRFAYRGGEPAAANLKASAVRESSDSPDPVALQRAFDGDAPGSDTADAGTPATRHSGKAQDRANDVFQPRENLPEAKGIRPEYVNSGRWILRPGT